MASGTFLNGDYEIDDDANGDLVIKDPNGNEVFKWDNTNGKWVMGSNAPLDIAELIDGGGQSHTGALEDDNHVTEHEEAGGDAITIGNLLNFDPVELLIDTNANRPAAGTADRIFIESDTGKVLRDNGTSYDPVGTTDILETNHAASDHESGGSLPITFGNLASVDATALLITTEANKPAAGTTDRLAVVTDATGGAEVQRDDGTSWNAVSKIRSSESIQDIIGNAMIEPLDYDDTNNNYEISLSTQLQVDGSNNLDVAEGNIDAGDLSGASATSGQVLESDGTNANWSSPPSNTPDWTEDANSPIDVTGVSSVTYTVDGTYDYIMVIADPQNVGFDELQVNADTGTNYDRLDNSDTQTTSDSKWPISDAFRRKSFTLIAETNSIFLTQEFGGTGTGQLISGSNSNVSRPINQFTLADSGGANRDTFARVYGLTL